MAAFAALLLRSGDRWTGREAELEDCESLSDLADVLRDETGEARLLVIEQDDEFAAIVRLDAEDDEPRAFLTDGHAADRYVLAEAVAEDLEEVGGDELADDPLAPEVTAVAHDSAPFGAPDLVEDLGTSAAELLELCEHGGTLPIDVLMSVCEKAGCAEVFEELRG